MPPAKIGHGNSLWIPRIRNLYRAADWKKRGKRSPACCGTASRAVWPGVEASVFVVGQAFGCAAATGPVRVAVRG